jgi:hypothetical protein
MRNNNGIIEMEKIGVVTRAVTRCYGSLQAVK